MAAGPPDSKHAPGTSTRALRAVVTFLATYWVYVAILVLVLVVTSVVAPHFFSARNMVNIARQSATLGVVAVGMTFVILTKGIDLTVGSVLAVASSSFAAMLLAGMPLGLSFVATLAIGALVGLWNGFGITRFGVPPFVMTLAGLVVFRGLALRIADGSPRPYSHDSQLLDFLGRGFVGPVPGPVVVFLVLAVVAWAVLRYLPFGRHLRAIGGNEEAARLAGIRINRTLVAVYVISGACAALAGIMTAARLEVGDPTAGHLMELDAIAAVVIGGTSLFGGIGSMWGSVAGTLLLGVVANVLNLAGVSPFEQMMVRGLLILVAVMAQQSGVGRILARRETTASVAVPAAAVQQPPDPAAAREKEAAP